MSIIVIEVYDALISAGADEDKARAAATVLADINDRKDVVVLKQDITVLRQDIAAIKQDIIGLRQDVAILKSELHNIKWIINGVGFGILLLILKSFWPH
jgi:hypothetical protein